MSKIIYTGKAKDLNQAKDAVTGALNKNQFGGLEYFNGIDTEFLVEKYGLCCCRWIEGKAPQYISAPGLPSITAPGEFACYVLEQPRKTPQQDAWNIVVGALRLHFLQGNSQIPNIGDWIEKQVVDTLQIIRKTAKSKSTQSMVDAAPPSSYSRAEND